MQSYYIKAFWQMNDGIIISSLGVSVHRQADFQTKFNEFTL